MPRVCAGARMCANRQITCGALGTTLALHSALKNHSRTYVKHAFAVVILQAAHVRIDRYEGWRWMRGRGHGRRFRRSQLLGTQLSSASRALWAIRGSGVVHRSGVSLIASFGSLGCGRLEPNRPESFTLWPSTQRPLSHALAVGSDQHRRPHHERQSVDLWLSHVFLPCGRLSARISKGAPRGHFQLL